MTTQTMLEKVARAIYAEMRFEEDDPWDRVIARSKELGFPEGSLNGNQTRAMFIARAALQALREPTEEMIDAPRGLIMYFNAPPGEGYPLGRHAKSGEYGDGYAHLLTDREKRMHSFPKAHQASLVFRAMIDTALQEKFDER